MNEKFRNILIIITATLLLLSCQAVTKKIDEKTKKEEMELNKWLNQPEHELKIVFGKPDKIELKDNMTKHYFYISEKLKIKCERRFEINSNNVITGFISKNCF